MKHFKKILLVLLIIPCVFILNACSFGNKQIYVTGIEQTSVVGTKTTYTVHYSNGTTSLFSVNNGENGEDGNDLTLASIRAYCDANQINFESFLTEYFTIVNQTAPTVQDASNKALQSAVTIYCEHPIITAYSKDTQIACGAGVIYQMGEDYSYIVTNYHVIYSNDSTEITNIAKKITIFQYGTSEIIQETDLTNNGYPVYSYGDGAIEATYAGGSLTYDLAILKVKTDDLLKYNPNASAITIANDYQVGETVIAIGNPEGLGFSVTSGIISVESDETLSLYGADDVTIISPRVIRIDAAVNGGNSGGGLFDINGHLVGIVNARLVSYEIENMAYALPCDNVKAVVDNLIYYYEATNIASQVKKLNLNITTSSENRRANYNTETNRTVITEDIVVKSISAGIGNNIGLKIDDKIKKININGTEHTLTRSYQLADLLITIRPNDKFIIEVERNGAVVELGIATEDGVLESQLTIVR